MMNVPVTPRGHYNRELITARNSIDYWTKFEWRYSFSMLNEPAWWLQKLHLLGISDCVTIRGVAVPGKNLARLGMHRNLREFGKASKLFFESVVRVFKRYASMHGAVLHITYNIKWSRMDITLPFLVCIFPFKVDSDSGRHVYYMHLSKRGSDQTKISCRVKYSLAKNSKICDYYLSHNPDCLTTKGMIKTTK